MGNTAGAAVSTSTAGISGIAGHREVRSGALSAALSQWTVPRLAELLRDLPLPEPVAQGLLVAAAAAGGAAAGGSQGAMIAGNATVNNFLNHQQSSERLRLREQLFQCTTEQCRQSLQARIDELDHLDNWTDQQLQQACRSLSSAECAWWNQQLQQAAQSYHGQFGHHVDRAEQSQVLQMAGRVDRAVRNPLGYGLGGRLLEVTPPGAIMGAAAVLPEALPPFLQSVQQQGLGMTVAEAIVNLPWAVQAGARHWWDNLNSGDPQQVGSAIGTVLAVPWASAQLLRPRPGATGGAAAGAEVGGVGARGVPQLAAPVMHQHHLMPRQFKEFFGERGIDIDAHAISLGEKSHLTGVHGKGLGNMPGGWNKEWAGWISKNPNASAKDVYQQLGTMMDRYKINDLPIHPYKP